MREFWILSLQKCYEIEIHIDGNRDFGINKSPKARELLARLKKYRGSLPSDFKFDRLDANENN